MLVTLLRSLPSIPQQMTPWHSPACLKLLVLYTYFWGNMSVAFWDAEGVHYELRDGVGRCFAYYVAPESGALQIMQVFDRGPSRVYMELSGNSWRKVLGTRHIMPGSIAVGRERIPLSDGRGGARRLATGVLSLSLVKSLELLPSGRNPSW